MNTCATILVILAIISKCQSRNFTQQREQRLFSLFSIVQFQNDECTSVSSSTTLGTCFTSSECSAKSGTASGNCAAGFGVCCVIAVSECGSTISTNTSYIRNPGYPSSYTATSAGTCTFTIKKVSSDICQLRLDFQTFSGYTNTLGICGDTFAAAGQTGSNPPSICGTNTGYHMYVEFGTSDTDSVTLTNTWATSGLATPKSYNILARQIPCTATYKAPTDCVQYFTGTAGNIQSYNFQGAQMLNAQVYNNCIRTEKGYCAIQWKQSSSTSPDPYQVGYKATSTIDNTDCGPTSEYGAFTSIPGLSPDGVLPIPIPNGQVTYLTEVCGSGFGIEDATTAANGVAQALTTKKQPFILGVFTHATHAFTSGVTGFNMDYTQLAC